MNYSIMAVLKLNKYRIHTLISIHCYIYVI